MMKKQKKIITLKKLLYDVKNQENKELFYIKRFD